MFTKEELKETKELMDDLKKEGLPDKTIEAVGLTYLKTAKYRRKETLKQIKMSEESKSVGQISCYINKDWEKRWIPFIKYDWDWDFAFIETLIIKKLKLMREFYNHDLNEECENKNTTNSVIKNLRIVEQIDSVLRLYDAYSNSTAVGEEEKKLRVRFYHKLAILSGNWWD